MNDLGSIQASQFYSNSVASAYRTNQASSLKEVQPSAEKSLASDENKDDIVDEAIISDEAMSMLAAEKTDAENEDKMVNADEKKDSEQKTTKSQDDLTPEEKEQVAKLKESDAEVKAHEQAHLAAAAGISASSPSYDYQTGPDGKKYAVGGEVSISFVKSDDPEENLKNAQTMKAAALAPAEPSGQDLSVARNADKLIAEAKQEMAEEKSSSDTPSTQASDESKTESAETPANREKNNESVPVGK